MEKNRLEIGGCGAVEKVDPSNGQSGLRHQKQGSIAAIEPFSTTPLSLVSIFIVYDICYLSL